MGCRVSRATRINQQALRRDFNHHSINQRYGTHTIQRPPLLRLRLPPPLLPRLRHPIPRLPPRPPPRPSRRPRHRALFRACRRGGYVSFDTVFSHQSHQSTNQSIDRLIDQIRSMTRRRPIHTYTPPTCCCRAGGIPLQSLRVRIARHAGDSWDPTRPRPSSIRRGGVSDCDKPPTTTRGLAGWCGRPREQHEEGQEEGDHRFSWVKRDRRARRCEGVGGAGPSASRCRRDSLRHW